MIKPPSCSSCPLYSLSNGFILSEGKGTSGVIILGEAGGYEEYLSATPFVKTAASGSVLEKAIKLASSDLSIPLTRESFLIYNIVNCNPPKNELEGKWYQEGAVKCCSTNVSRVIRGLKVGEGKRKVILALGNIAMREMAGFTGNSESKQSITNLRGFVFENGNYNCYVVPSLHPSYIRRGNLELLALLAEDIKKSIRVANGEITNFPCHVSYIKPNYIEHSNLDMLVSFYNKVRDNSKLLVTYDIETPYSTTVDEDTRLEDIGIQQTQEDRTITQIQFSTGKNSAICVKWNDTNLNWIKKIMMTENPKAGFNCWNFDNPRIKEKGVRINGRNDDVMWMFKHYQPRLPRNLQSVASLANFPFPWKHLFGSKLEWYGCADVASLHWIIPELVKSMRNI